MIVITSMVSVRSYLCLNNIAV